ncbi:sulfite exporter TauE/SafE family protein [Aliidiomarina sedimenti]|uniref:Probable membrane transporter protein n=1 Tax=Aliidiomarina sedimenti TaxID=1933879 RepID=A0ABY0BXD8_9GAMM|nr:sulfite exporter TauE/SafE family protein [Aliidiomarina sedimenti]RUO28826.1 sulfite exporter TauE/SafE family protein [Aliidiomarina sedimenti]
MALFGALIIGLSLGLFGSGGSILTVPVLLYLLHQDPQVAIASSLLIVAGISFFGSVQNAFKKLISWRHVGFFGVPGVFGTWLGALAGLMVDPRWQLLVFSLLMIVAAYMMWRARLPELGAPIVIRPWKVMAEGLIVGCITGFVGVGGGFLIVPALVLLGGLSMPIGIATSLVIIALKSVVGFTQYYVPMTNAGYQFEMGVIATMIVAGVIGSFGGSWLAIRLPKQKMQRGFAVFLVLMAAVVIYQSVL